MPMDWGFDVSQGFSSLASVSTGVGGTGASDVVGTTMGQTEGQTRASALAPIKGCAVCSNPTVQQAAFIIAVALLALGWHLHLYSVME